MENKKYHTVGAVPKYHTVGTVPKYHTVGTVLKSNRTITEMETKSILLTHIYMNGQFHGLIQALDWLNIYHIYDIFPQVMSCMSDFVPVPC